MGLGMREMRWGAGVLLARGVPRGAALLEGGGGQLTSGLVLSTRGGSSRGCKLWRLEAGVRLESRRPGCVLDLKFERSASAS